MIKAIFNGLFKMINKLISVIFQPLNSLILALFPNFMNIISTFDNFVQNYIGSNLAYFINIFPPIFRTVLFVAIEFMISYYTFSLTYKGITKIYGIIQKIKFW